MNVVKSEDLPEALAVSISEHYQFWWKDISLIKYIEKVSVGNWETKCLIDFLELESWKEV